MDWLKNLKIGSKLAMGFGLSMLLVIIVGGISINNLATLNTEANNIYHDSLVATGTTARIISTMKEFRLLEWLHIVTTDDNARNGLESQMTAKAGEMDGLLNDYAKGIHFADDRTNFNSLKSSWTDYKGLNDAIITLSRMNDTGSSRDFMMGDSLAKFTAATNAADAMASWNIHRGQDLAGQARHTYLVSRTVVAILILAALLVGFFSGFIIVKNITGALGEISGQMTALSDVAITNLRQGVKALAAGDLTTEVICSGVPLTVTSSDEIGAMTRTFNDMQHRTMETVEAFRQTQQSLRSLIGDVAISANSLAATSSQLSTLSGNSQSLSKGIGESIQEVATGSDSAASSCLEMARETATQRAALDETNASINEAAKTVEFVARSAEQVSKIATGSAEIARSGAKAVDDTIGRMSRIQQQVEQSAETVRSLGVQSKEISAITAVIDKIAEQTNLLALNAAIEAARAGEHGRGFAVVADEVRKLAEHSVGATREITTRIAGIQAEVDNAIASMKVSTDEVKAGSEQSHTASDALTQIIKTTEQVVRELEPVREAANEMSASIHKVLSAADTANRVSENNEIAVTSLSSVAEELAASAQRVAEIVRQQDVEIQSVDNSAGHLLEMATALQDLVSQFKIGSDIEQTRKEHTQLRRAA
jgi:methyl-accepting chemotaxis protein